MTEPTKARADAAERSAAFALLVHSAAPDLATLRAAALWLVLAAGLEALGPLLGKAFIDTYLLPRNPDLPAIAGLLGGALLAATGIEGALTLATLLYLPPIVAAWRLEYRNPFLAGGRAALIARIASGFAVVRHDPRLLGVMVVTVIFNLWGWPATSMVPVIGAGALALSAPQIGVLAGMDGLGSLVAAVFLAVWLRPGGFRASYVGGTAAYLAATVAFALAPGPLTAGVALLGVGMASAGFSVMQSTLVYVLAPAEARSRVFGVLAVCIGSAPIGFLHVGLLADWLGAPAATALTGIEGLLALALTRRWWHRI